MSVSRSEVATKRSGFPAFSTRTARALLAATGVVALWLAVPLTVPASAAAAELAGSWSGAGTFTLASGARERARCRARYTPAGGKRIAMAGACATGSAKVSQTAILRKTGANSYAGTFYNPEYGVTGRIRINVSGNRQAVFLSGDGGRAAFSLSRR